MDNFVTVVQGNDFTLNIALSTPNKETQATDPYDIRDAKSLEVKLISQINGHVLRLDPFEIVGNNVISTLVSGTKLKLTDYDVEVSFVKGGLNKRAYECNIIHVVRCQGDTDYSTQDTEGENGYGIDLTMGIDLEVVNLGKNVNTGGSGTSDYNDLEHKPSINDVVLEGNKTLEDLGIMGSDKAYTKEEVNQALETKADKTLVDTFSQKVDSLEESLNRKANTTDIPSRLSELENDLKTKTINGQSIFGEGNMEIPSGQDNVIEKIKVNGTELPVENKEVNIKVPTKVSELDNDSHFLSEHQDLSNYVQKEKDKGLSSNDFTDAEKAKLAGLKNYDDTQVRELIAGKADLQHQHTVADITDFPELYYDATAFLTSEAYPSDKYEELLEAVKAKKTVYATIDEEGYTSYIFFMSSANSDGSSSRVLLTTIFADGGYLYMNTFVLQQSGMTPLRENISGKVDKEPGKGLSTNDLTDERAGKVDKLKIDGRANEYLNGAGIYSRPVRQGYGVSVSDDNTVSVDPQVIARQSDVASVAANLAQYAKTAEVTEMINRAVVSAINTEI